MQLNLDSKRSKTTVIAYSEQGIQIGDRWYKSSVLLTADHIFDSWQPHSIAILQLNDLELIFPYKPEVLILGTGKNIQFPPQSLYAELASLGIGLEVMNTEAACRTYNLLASDDRAVVAALCLDC